MTGAFTCAQAAYPTMRYATDTIEAHPGHVEALVPPAENIHSVHAGGDELTISIHVYGADIERLGSSVYRRFDDLALAS